MSAATVTLTWRARAACRGDDPRLWDITESDDAERRADNWDAVLTCALCPVQAQCLADALATRSVGVIRGGVPFSESTQRRPPARACVVCGESFTPKTGPNPAIYCGEACRRPAELAKHLARKKARQQRKREARAAAGGSVVGERAEPGAVGLQLGEPGVGDQSSARRAAAGGVRDDRRLAAVVGGVDAVSEGVAELSGLHHPDLIHVRTVPSVRTVRSVR